MSRYAAAHTNPKGAGDARPTALQIIADEGVGAKLTGKVMVITGAASGIGLETARALSTTGATLYLTARDLAKAETALAGILEPGSVELVEMDNTSFASVRTGAADILARSKGKINILINNAGVMGVQELTLTGDGHEMHFATNHLSHFLLFQLLKPALLASSTPDFHSRVVNVGSSTHRMSRLNASDNYSFEKGGYDHGSAYATSKLANTYMANELDRRYGQRGLHATSVHPGGIVTNIIRHMGPGFKEGFMSVESITRVLKDPSQGAATTVLAAVGKEWEDRGGVYLEDCGESKPGEDFSHPLGVGYAPHAYDAEEEARLWKDSLKIVGIQDDS